MEEKVEPHYIHLLQPIRDLAENWNIDLARELEEYISDLEKMKISFDGGQTTVNFAEGLIHT